MTGCIATRLPRDDVVGEQAAERRDVKIVKRTLAVLVVGVLVVGAGDLAFGAWQAHQASKRAEAKIVARNEAREREAARHRFTFSPRESLAFSNCALGVLYQRGSTSNSALHQAASTCLPAHIDPANTDMFADCLEAGLSWNPDSAKELADFLSFDCLPHAGP